MAKYIVYDSLGCDGESSSREESVCLAEACALKLAGEFHRKADASMQLILHTYRISNRQ